LAPWKTKSYRDSFLLRKFHHSLRTALAAHTTRRGIKKHARGGGFPGAVDSTSALVTRWCTWRGNSRSLRSRRDRRRRWSGWLSLWFSLCGLFFVFTSSHFLWYETRVAAEKFHFTCWWPKNTPVQVNPGDAFRVSFTTALLSQRSPALKTLTSRTFPNHHDRYIIKSR
jgi:hypothetical protein